MPFPLEMRFVRQAEEKLARKLPLGYLSRICRSNGGELAVGTDVFRLYPVLDSTDRKRLSRTCNDIVRETASARQWPRFPPDGLAIGGNGGGDKLVLMAEADTERFTDAVYWWDHETGELHFVADSLDDLS